MATNIEPVVVHDEKPKFIIFHPTAMIPLQMCGGIFFTIKITGKISDISAALDISRYLISQRNFEQLINIYMRGLNNGLTERHYNKNHR